MLFRFGMADVFIYEAITNDSLKRVKNQIKGPEDINLRINSLGGNVFEGIGITNFLKSLPNKINTTIDGFAGSIATMIMLTGKNVTASKGSFIMVHRAQSLAGGNQTQLQSTLKILKQVDNQLIKAYQHKTKLPKADIEILMDNETIMSADEAHKLGFVDNVGSSLDIAAYYNLNKDNMDNIFEKLKAQAKSLLGEKSDNEETQKVIDDLAKAAKEEADKEVEAKAKAAETVGDAVLADKVSNKEYLAYTSQMTEFITNCLQAFTAFEERLTKSEEEQDAKIIAKMDALLAKVKSGGEVPASSNSFSEVNQEPVVDIQDIQKMQVKRVEQHKN